MRVSIEYFRFQITAASLRTNQKIELDHILFPLSTSNPNIRITGVGLNRCAVFVTMSERNPAISEQYNIA